MALIPSMMAGVGLGFFVEGLKAGTNAAWTYISPTSSTLENAVDSKLPAGWREN